MGAYWFECEKIYFNDLSEEMQEKLYLKDKEKFKNYVAKSKYERIRRLVIEDEKCDSDTLEQIFELETILYHNVYNLKIVLQHPNFKMDEQKRQLLAESDNVQIKLMVVENEKTTSQMLNQILRREIEQTNSEELIQEILRNSNFEMEEETLIKLSESEHLCHRCLAAGSENASSEFLNQMYREEIQGDQECDVIELILNNSNFKMEDETRKVLAQSDDVTQREVAAEDQDGSSEFLNWMIRREVETFNNKDVIKLILNNQNFKMEDETRRVLAESNDFGNRMYAAKESSNPSEFLNWMIRKEIQSDDNCFVVNEILGHPNFKMEDATREVMARAEDDNHRCMIAEDPQTSTELLEEMYLKETIEYVLEEIEKNLLTRLDKSSVKLDAIQKRKIMDVLKETRKSKVPLIKYLKQISKILG